MKATIVTIFLLIVLFPAKADQQFPEIQGWQLSEETRVFDQENLFDYINGAAELFFTYGFERLYVKEYEREDEMVKVEIYRHANLLNAFGMYSQERYQEGGFLNIGAQGYGGEGYLNFLKDRYYVKVITYNTSLEDLQMIAGKVAEKLEGKDEFPTELSNLPVKGRIESSEKFVSTNFLGLSFLDKVVTANYSLEGNNFSMFYIQKDPEQLKDILTKYYRFARTPQKKIKEGYHEIKDPYNGIIFLKWEKNKMIGFVDMTDKKLQKELLP